MYTQCPECGTAFRVTAEVLKQAAGKVRCGGCSIAFNALDYLSEQKPAATPAPTADGTVPELTPDSAELEPVKPPKTISAEQSAALLKTLDELAGSDIRIEDTGVEWRVLDENEEDDAKPLSTSEEAAQIAGGEEMRFDDDTPLPDDFDFDREPSGEPAPVIDSRDDPSDLEAAQVDLAFGDPEDWEDLLGEVDEEEIDEDIDDDSEESIVDDIGVEPLPDVDEQFATQAEAMGIDLSGIHARGEEEAPAEDRLEETSIDEDLIAAAFEAEAEARDQQEEAVETEPDLDLEEEEEEKENDATKISAEEEDDDLEFELDFDDEDLAEARDKELVVSTEEDARLAAELGLDDQADEDESEKPEPLILPQSEDEKTVNMMIDEDLLAIAVEDEEGFTSTIVQKQSGDEVRALDDVAQDDEPADEEPVAAVDAENPLVETIIMEGEYIRDADAEEELEEARKKSGDPSLKSAAAAQIAGLAKAVEPPPKEPINYGLVAGIAGLTLLFLLQALHQYREALATFPVFSNSVGSIYRMLGRPVTPAWDISGWRFEATKGSADDDEILTIYSRVGNKSNDPLPYPLISVSLTDRFEDIIGSKVLEPGDYLAENLDTRRPVEPGDTFSAVISIEAPDAEATGFKLNVCYRQPGGQLKCAIDDFK